MDEVNDYTCICADGYTGKNCSVGRYRVSILILSSHCQFMSINK